MFYYTYVLQSIKSKHYYTGFTPGLYGMKLIYIANQRMPTEKAYGIQITKMCEAFVMNGAEVELLIPNRGNLGGKDIFNFYNVRRNFKITQVNSFDLYLPGVLDKIAFLFKQSISTLVLLKTALRNNHDIMYFRDEFPIFLASYNSEHPKLVFEAHKFSKRRKFFYNRFRKAGIKIVAISSGLKNEFVKSGFNPDDVFVAHDGFDPKEFNVVETRLEIMTKFNLPIGKDIVMYAGHLFDWKGVDILVKAAQELTNNFLVVIVGGIKQDIDRLKSIDKLGRVRFEGLRAHNLIPAYLKAADILVLPNKKDGDISEFYTSPLKLFEYMASGKPIIAADLPSIREVSNDNNAFFFEPNNPDALIKTITMVYNDKKEAELRARQALKDADNYTWEKRAEKIINFITNN